MDTDFFRRISFPTDASKDTHSCQSDQGNNMVDYCRQNDWVDGKPELALNCWRISLANWVSPPSFRFFFPLSLKSSPSLSGTSSKLRQFDGPFWKLLTVRNIRHQKGASYTREILSDKAGLLLGEIFREDLWLPELHKLAISYIQSGRNNASWQWSFKDSSWGDASVHVVVVVLLLIVVLN